MTGGQRQAAIVGVGSSIYSREGDGDIVALAIKAAEAALADAGITAGEIDGYAGSPSATGSHAPHVDGLDEMSARLFSGKFCLERLRWSVDLFWDFTPSALVQASLAIAAGACSRVLVVRTISKLSSRVDRPAERVSGRTGLEPETLGIGTRFGADAARLLEAAGRPEDRFYPVIALARENASRNPYAIWRDRALGKQEYLNGPALAGPLTVYDSDIPVNGAVAFVVVSAEATFGNGDRPPVYLQGWAGWQNEGAIFANAQIDSNRLDLCQIYDGFSFFVPATLERLGLCDPGTSLAALRDGEFHRDGRLPVNTSGGSLGEGRLHGAGHLREAVLQLRGEAGARQIANARTCLVQVGPPDFSSTLILSSSPRSAP